MVPASLLRLDLMGSLHWPPVHKILDDQYPVCDLVVPGSRQAMAGGQTECFHKALDHMEVHEGLFPHLGEYGADKGMVQTIIPIFLWGCLTLCAVSRMLGWEQETGFYHC